MAGVSYGEGTLFQRASGRWVKRYQAPDGKWRSTSWPTKPTREMVRARIVELSRTSPDPPPSESVGAYLGRWLRDGTTNLRGRTVHRYRVLVTLHIVPALGDVALRDLSTPLIQRWVNNGALPAALVALRAALSEAVRWGLISVNPARSVRQLHRDRKQHAILSPDQMRALLAQVKGDTLEALYVLSAYTGLRQGEALGLRWQDVDLRAGTLTVAVSLWWKPSPNGREPVLTEPKTERSRRRIPLPAEVVEKLAEHRKRQMLQSRDGLVFTKPDGTALEPSTVYRALQRHLKAAKLPEIRWHDIRHSTASMLLESGWDVTAVSELLGHSTPFTTMTIYSHSLEERKTATAERMGMLLGARSVSEAG